MRFAKLRKGDQTAKAKLSSRIMNTALAADCGKSAGNVSLVIDRRRTGERGAVIILRNNITSAKQGFVSCPTLRMGQRVDMQTCLELSKRVNL